MASPSPGTLLTVSERGELLNLLRVCDSNVLESAV